MSSIGSLGGLAGLLSALVKSSWRSHTLRNWGLGSRLSARRPCIRDGPRILFVAFFKVLSDVLA